MTIGSRVQVPIETLIKVPKATAATNRKGVSLMQPTLVMGRSLIDFVSYKNIGPGLYDWEEDGEFTA